MDPVIPSSPELVPDSVPESCESSLNPPESFIAVPDLSLQAATITTLEPDPSVTHVPSIASQKSTTRTPTPPSVPIQTST